MMSTPSTPVTGTSASSVDSPNNNMISSPPGSFPPKPPPQATAAAPATHEERLRRTWRTIGTAAVQMMSKAEKAAALAVQQTPSENPAMKEAFRDVDDSVVTFLRTRIEFHRLLSHVEAKLQGKAEDMESLETYIKTEPKVGGHNCNRKRKLQEVAGSGAVKEAST